MDAGGGVIELAYDVSPDVDVHIVGSKEICDSAINANRFYDS